MFIMSLLFIVMMIAAPAITGANVLDIDWSVDTFMPTFDGKFFLNLSILVFAVGGCEEDLTVCKQDEESFQGFCKRYDRAGNNGCCLRSTWNHRSGMMFDSNNIPEDLMTNGAYYAFQMLGEYYHVGDLFVIIYAVVNLICQFSVMVLSIDAPLRMLLDSAMRNTSRNHCSSRTNTAHIPTDTSLYLSSYPS